MSDFAEHGLFHYRSDITSNNINVNKMQLVAVT